jgi:hypothetical protein
MSPEQSKWAEFLHCDSASTYAREDGFGVQSVVLGSRQRMFRPSVSPRASVRGPRETSVYCQRVVYGVPPTNSVATGSKPCQARGQKLRHTFLGVGGPAFRRKRVGRDLEGILLLLSAFPAAKYTARSTGAHRTERASDSWCHGSRGNLQGRPEGITSPLQARRCKGKSWRMRCPRR